MSRWWSRLRAVLHLARCLPAPKKTATVRNPFLRRARLDLEPLEGRLVPSGNPVAVDDSYSVLHDHTAIVSPLDNDSAAPGATLTPSVVSYPAHAYVIFNADNTLTVEPNIGFVGSDSMTYKFNDGNADSNTATITITVTNHTPTATDFGPLTVHHGATLTGIDLAGGGSDADGDKLTARVVGYPAHGYLYQDYGTGLWAYAADTSYTGADSFTYVANDGAADSNTATVSLTVTNTPPTAADLGPLSVHQGAILTGIGLAGSGSDADNDPLTARVVTQPAHGSLWYDSYAGSWVYDSYGGFVGTDTAAFVVNDGAADSNTATVTFNLTDTAPTAGDLGPFTLHHDTSVTGINLLAAASDVDNDWLSVRVLTQPAHGSLWQDWYTGQWAYTPFIGYVGPDSATFVANDGAADSNPATISFNVTDTPPTAVDQGPFAVWQGQAVTGINLLAGASDADGDPLSAQVVTQPTHGSLNYNYYTGLWDYYANTGYVGPDSFGFVANDGAADSNVATVGFIVTDPVSLATPGDQRNYNGDSVSFGAGASDATGAALTFTISGQPPGVTIDPNAGLVSGTISLSAGDSRDYTTTITATDGSYSASQSFDWKVGDVFAFSSGTYMVNESDGVATITVLRSGSAVGTASVMFATSDATAVAGVDYVSTSGQFDFANGQTSDTIVVPLIDSGQTSDQETFDLSLSVPSTSDTADPVLYFTVLTIMLQNNPPPPRNLDYWNAQALPAGQSASWDVDTNWLLGRRPAPGDDAIFDPGFSTTPCVLPAGSVATPLLVRFNPNWTSTLTVGGSLSTPSLTLSDRNRSGQEIIINATGQVEVTSQLTFAGGNISGDGTLLVDGGGVISITGTNANDRPTIGCPVQIGSPDGRTAGGLGWGLSVQPLVVTGNASISVNPRGTIVFCGSPRVGDTVVSAISNGDGGNETLVVNGGRVESNGDHEQVVGMGVQLNSGDILAGGTRTLHFTGRNAGTYGLEMYGGQLLIGGRMAFDQGALIMGGTILQADGSSVLTLGLAAASPMSMMSGGTVNLPGVLIAHGGFDMTGGLIDTVGSLTSAITVDNNTMFWFAGGQLLIEGGFGNNGVVTQLTVNGDFQGTGGSIELNVDTTGGGHARGQLQVNGDLSLATDLLFICWDLNPNPGNQNWQWNPLQWTGNRVATMSFGLLPGWTSNWDDVNRRLVIGQP